MPSLFILQESARILLYHAPYSFFSYSEEHSILQLRYRLHSPIDDAQIYLTLPSPREWKLNIVMGSLSQRYVAHRFL